MLWISESPKKWVLHHKEHNNLTQLTSSSFIFLALSHTTTMTSLHNSSTLHPTLLHNSFSQVIQKSHTLSCFIFNILKCGSVTEASHFSFSSKRCRFLHCQSCPRALCFFSFTRFVLFSFGSAQVEFPAPIILWW